MDTKKKKQNIPILIMCIILFIVMWGVQVYLTSGTNPEVEKIMLQAQGLAQTNNIDMGDVIRPLEDLAKTKSQPVNDIVSQLQLMISVVLVLTNRKKGFISAIILNIINVIYVVVIPVVLNGNNGAIPAITMSVVSMVLSSIIYSHVTSADKMHGELTASYEQAIENNRLMQEKDDVLSYMAYYDRTTDMPNRQLFMETIEDHVRKKEECIILYADIDNFRHMNDSLGHKAGDELITEYAKRIKETLPDDIFSARIGGDEFGFIIPGKSEQGAINLAERLNKMFSAVANIRNEEISMTASIGGACFPNDAMTSEDVFRCAESAMFSAKSSGKKQFRLYRHSMR